MIREVADAGASTRAGFDEIIDVRSPAEFAQDRLPGAINLPVLSDAQRHEVGEIYVQTSKLLARRIGASYVARNIADHLAGPLSSRPGSYAPLVYCWRGGQRSAAMASVLSQVGWRVGLVRGGYRTYRREVVRALYESGESLPVVLLCGPTGSGKTELLPHLARHGVQSLDLEGLASHRGSLFGDLPGEPQPTQKLFESRLAEALGRLDPARPIVVEAESSRIGELRLPPRLWRAMQEAPRVRLESPLEARVARIARTYRPFLADPAALRDRLDRLPRHHGRAQREAWAAESEAGDAEALARALLLEHYDPAYRQAAAARSGPDLGPADASGDLDRTAAAVAARVEAWIAARG